MVKKSSRPQCICCQSCSVKKGNKLFCINCQKFIHRKLDLTNEFVSAKLHNTDIPKIRVKRHCALCGEIAIMTYKHIETNKNYHLCKAHLDRWLKIGCEMAEFVKLIGD